MAAEGRPPPRRGLYWSQLRAMLVRNIYLKKRDTRKTIAEILVPLYSLGVLIVMKILVPNPNFPEIAEPRGEAFLFQHFQRVNHTVAVVPNNTETLEFLEEMNNQLQTLPDMQPITWVLFQTQEQLLGEYWSRPESIPMAVIFQTNPMTPAHQLVYTIRTNPSVVVTPSTRSLWSSPAICRVSPTHWTSGYFPIQAGEQCPVNQYFYSGFIALQALIDYTKIKLESGREDLPMPNISLEMFPKPAYTGNWIVAFRIVIPIYMVMTLSQFITYLLMLVVGEKENKIREGMRIMGLIDSVYWASWFILYAGFVLVLSIVCTVLLFTLKVFQHSSYILVFLLILLFGFTIIMFGFLLTPFFDKARTAGILGNFAVNLMSMLYFIQVFVSNADSVAFWFVSLISSSGFALAMDKALVLDMAGEGVTWDNLWNGPGIPYGGSLIMMAFDTVLYGLLAYYLDAVIPSEHGIKRRPWFCLLPSFWCGSKHKSHSSTFHANSNGETMNNQFNKDIEPVPRELRDKEAIRIVSLYKSYRNCRRAEVKAVDGIDLSIYEGQITAILGHNGAGKSTLFNILTGLTAPTTGTAYVFGLDVRDPQDMSEIRRMTGVCPQHDILFDLLTVKQHLMFFAAVRGIPMWRREKEVARTLQEVSLAEQTHKFAKHLSGGQKRKLSVAIAIIGDPKIIILDEPTAGVDPISRRHMWRILQRLRAGKVLLLTTHFMDEADILGDRKAVISKGRLRCAGTSLFLKNKFGIGYHLTLVLDGVCREHQITRLVTSRVARAEKARRHGRELSYILPHNAVHQFASLFTAIEEEINTKASRLGICSYGVSMTTLEEVFLHLEGEGEEPGGPVDGLSRKLVRARALSRSLSLQSKSPSYQELHDKDGNTGAHTLPTDAHFNHTVQGQAQLQAGVGAGTALLAPGHSPGGTTGLALHATGHGIEHVKVSGGNNANVAGVVCPPPDLSQMLERIKVRPNTLQTFRALIWLRTIRMIRDPYKLYMLIILPIVFAAFGLYVKSREVSFLKMHPLQLDGMTYKNKTSVALHDATGRENGVAGLSEGLGSLGAGPVDSDYDGSFPGLLMMMPNMAAFNVNAIGLRDLSVVAMYNDTFTHSLPIIVNLLSNVLFKMAMQDSGLIEKWRPIEVSAHPLQQTAQPEEFDLGIISCALFMGMIFVLVPVSLAVDMVYDREIKAKNQLRVNGLSLGLYFATYFAVLAVVMLIITIALIFLVILNDIPSLREPPAMITLSTQLALYCPASILFSTSLSYIFDRMDSAQSILPNIATWVGMIPFILVAGLDMFRLGGNWAFGLHCTFSLLNTMYIPYALVYYVDRVHLMCRLSAACAKLTLIDYATREILVLAAGSILHIPLWCAVLRCVDALKAGARPSDVFSFGRKKKRSPLSRDESEDSELGPQTVVGVPGVTSTEPVEHEDADVRRERHRVAGLLKSPPPNPPVLMVHNLRKEYKRTIVSACCREGGSCGCMGGNQHGESESCGEGDRGGAATTASMEGTPGSCQAAVASLSLAVEAGEVFGLLGHNGAGKTTTMKIITAEEAPTYGTVVLGGHNVTSSSHEAFQMLGYCPQHDALWKNITVREHLECYAAIRGVPKQDIASIVDLYLSGLQIAEHSGKHTDECSGGTRRKLSFAMAMVGAPRLVLLDEPSTGMDPRSKRFLWDTILASFQGKKGAILTTHSMEEADALCSRVGIMVKGGLRCIGSTQHLKNLYGAGYTLEMKLSPPPRHRRPSDMVSSTRPPISGVLSPARILIAPGINIPNGSVSPSLGEKDEVEDSEAGSLLEEDAGSGVMECGVDANIHTPLVGVPDTHNDYDDEDELAHRNSISTQSRVASEADSLMQESSGGVAAARQFVGELFPDAKLEESFADRLVFSVPQHGVTSLARCFAKLEASKESLRIVEYSFSQTTLEQVFLKFAQYDEVQENETVDH